MVKSQSTTSDLSTYQKLILYLSKTHPEYTASDFKDALYTFRQERQTLAGLNLDRIEESLLDIVRRKYPDEKVRLSLRLVYDVVCSHICFSPSD